MVGLNEYLNREYSFGSNAPSSELPVQTCKPKYFLTIYPGI